MFYLVYGNQSSTIKNKVKKIASSFLDNNVDEFNFVSIDGFNVTVQEAVDECRYSSLGCDKKVVLLENCYFLSKTKIKNKIDSEQLFDDLLNYINDDDDPNCCLILSVNDLSIDEKNPIFKALKQKGNIVQIDDPDEKNFLEYIKLYCSKHNIMIDKEAIFELASRTNGDVLLFKNNIEKLSLYTNHIKYEDVTKLVARKLDDEAYLLSNYLLDGQNMDAIKLYKDLRVFNIEPVILISQLANQFRLMNEIRFLLKNKRYTPDEVAKELSIKPGRVFVMSKKIALCSEEAINDALEQLFKLDTEIKSGLVDRFYAFELFLINFKRN